MRKYNTFTTLALFTSNSMDNKYQGFLLQYISVSVMWVENVLRRGGVNPAISLIPSVPKRYSGNMTHIKSTDQIIRY